VVNNDASSALTGPEILLGAQRTLTVTAGSVINAQGRKSGNTNSLLLTGNGALLRASTGDRVSVARTNADGSLGVLDVAADVALRSTGSLTLDASSNLSLNSAAVIDAAQLDLSSVKVSVGNVPGTVTGTVLTGATLANLSSAKNLL